MTTTNYNLIKTGEIVYLSGYPETVPRYNNFGIEQSDTTLVLSLIEVNQVDESLHDKIKDNILGTEFTISNQQLGVGSKPKLREKNIKKIEKEIKEDKQLKTKDLSSLINFMKKG